MDLSSLRAFPSITYSIPLYAFAYFNILELLKSYELFVSNYHVSFISEWILLSREGFYF